MRVTLPESRVSPAVSVPGDVVELNHRLVACRTWAVPVSAVVRAGSAAEAHDVVRRALAPIEAARVFEVAAVTAGTVELVGTPSSAERARRAKAIRSTLDGHWSDPGLGGPA